ncbi:uncharacterized protein LOC131458716 isoform X1 [Solea solea]|uniref:uncharacterized protein LOC131458716 isoform X1 n=1 Tax=Solea solea TaxID=90069 RepID=UPI00272C4354|nr:uncharacterized protein LOC131458716 isoform X1 [Solea solea]
MLVLIQLLMTMMMKSKAAPQTVTVEARSGDAVLLPSEGQSWTRENVGDIRWTHRHLVLSLKNNRTTCEQHRRCELLSNGSLRFSHVHAEDAGNYSLQVFDPHGTRLVQIHFLLRVEEVKSKNPGEGQTNVLLPISCLSLLLLFFIIIIIFIVRKRTRRTTAEPKEEDVYMPMFGNHSNKRKQLVKEEESLYVPCYPLVSMETPQTKAEDVYV